MRKRRSFRPELLERRQLLAATLEAGETGLTVADLDPAQIGAVESADATSAPLDFTLGYAARQRIDAILAGTDTSATKGYRFGEAISAHVGPECDGVWKTDGTLATWNTVIRSPGALSLNLGFGQFSMPAGGVLSLRGEDEQRVEFTSQDNDEHGELWTPIFLGDTLELSVTLPESLRPELRLSVASVNHGFRSHEGTATPANTAHETSDASHEKSDKIGGDVSGSCNIDVVCGADDLPGVGQQIDAFRDEIRSVGAYTVGGIDTCSGSLINNTAGDGTPYFLTADHCGLSPTNAPSMVVYWNFECSFCRTPGSPASGGVADGRLDQFNSGAIFRSGAADSDFTLVELDDPIDPAHNVFFAGWDRSGVDPDSAVAIHHPAVAEKRISFEDDAVTTTAYFGEVGSGITHFRVEDWDAGTTEPGSSGSPLFDSSGRIVGQLHGGLAACGNDLDDWYGKFSVSWDGVSVASRLRDWLDPLNTGVTTLDGQNLVDLFDFGDANPEVYASDLAGDGARHAATGNLFLGDGVNYEPNVRGDTNARGDVDDGVVILSPPVAGGSFDVDVTASAAGVLDYFIDFDQDGVFGNNAGEVFTASLAAGRQTLSIAVPATAAGTTFARFRISSAGGLAATGLAADGEVEDYYLKVFAQAPELDFADASLGDIASNPARHVVDGARLGGVVSADDEPSQGDQLTGDDGDDGVIFTEPFVRGGVTLVTIESTGGILDAAFDFSGDGIFQADEQVRSQVFAGSDFVFIEVPDDAVLGKVRSQFRISDIGSEFARGLEFSGEVEDYQIVVIDFPSVMLTDFDSAAPPALPTGWTQTGTGANSWATSSEAGGFDSNHAVIENISSISDRSLVSPAVTVPENSNLVFDHELGLEESFDGGVLEIRIGGGAFEDIVAAGGSFVSGAYTGSLSTFYENPLGGRAAWTGSSIGVITTEVALPASAVGQTVQFRWRLGTDNSVSADPWRVDNIRWVAEDFEYDFGDAPDSYGTLSGSGGAAHIRSELSLGPSVDFETDGTPGGGAAGDIDDGVIIPGVLNAVDRFVEVNVGGSQSALLSVWLDLDANGQFDEPAVARDIPVVPGSQQVELDLPADLQATQTIARFRLSSNAGLDSQQIAGDGEVEDYVVAIEPAPLPQVHRIVINDGRDTRSALDSVEIHFDQLVSLDTGNLSAGIAMLDLDTGDVVPVSMSIREVSATAAIPRVHHVVRIEIAGTLPDIARYELLLDTDQITSVAGNLVGNHDGGQSYRHVDGLFRKYGDANGDDSVNLLDFADFRQTFGRSEGDTGYLPSLDYNGDGTVDLLDFAAFRRTFGS
ncbi:MAG: GEVED domain-containing protein [Planctomycetota bacterium]